jgi:ribonucleotide reductase beta subunit family protein with ferritin-like domain
MELAPELRHVGGAFDVDESARRIICYRYAEISSMEAAAGWIATIAAPKLKIVLAQHAYEDSLHADALGRRLPELRVMENVDMSIPPTLRVADVRRPANEEFARFVHQMQDQDDELLRLTGLYRVLKPHLAVYYRHHMTVTDQVSDAPTVRMLKFILVDEEEHVRWGQAIYEELADTPEKRRRALEWQMHLEEILAASGGVTGGR